MKDNRDIGELLNCFIDGELTQRQQTELQRLIKHDQRLGERLRRLQKCKMLVGSLPRVDAPAPMLERIKTSLQTRQILAQQAPALSEHQGARHLFARQLLTAAAMIMLLGILGVVLYSIVAPEQVEPLVANRTPDISVSPPANVTEAFYGRLELKSGSFAAVDSSINTALDDNGVAVSVARYPKEAKSIYTFTCSRENLKRLLTDLSDTWGRLDSARFAVETDKFGVETVVRAVTLGQVAEIVNCDAFETRIQTAKDLDALNKINELMPGREVFAAIQDRVPDLAIIPPKPIMTGKQGTGDKSPVEAADNQQVHLTIVLEK